MPIWHSCSGKLKVSSDQLFQLKIDLIHDFDPPELYFSLKLKNSEIFFPDCYKMIHPYQPNDCPGTMLPLATTNGKLKIKSIFEKHQLQQIYLYDLSLNCNIENMQYSSSPYTLWKPVEARNGFLYFPDTQSILHNLPNLQNPPPNLQSVVPQKVRWQAPNPQHIQSTPNVPVWRHRPTPWYLERQPSPDPPNRPAVIPERIGDPISPRQVETVSKSKNKTEDKTRNRPDFRVTPHHLKGVIEQIKQTLEIQTIANQSANSNRNSVHSVSVQENLQQPVKTNVQPHAQPSDRDSQQPISHEENIRYIKIPAENLPKNTNFHPTNLSSPANLPSAPLHVPMPRASQLAPMLQTDNEPPNLPILKHRQTVIEAPDDPPLRPFDQTYNLLDIDQSYQSDNDPSSTPRDPLPKPLDPKQQQRPVIGPLDTSHHSNDDHHSLQSNQAYNLNIEGAASLNLQNFGPPSAYQPIINEFLPELPASTIANNSSRSLNISSQDSMPETPPPPYKSFDQPPLASSEIQGSSKNTRVMDQNIVADNIVNVKRPDNTVSVKSSNRIRNRELQQNYQNETSELRRIIKETPDLDKTFSRYQISEHQDDQILPTFNLPDYLQPYVVNILTRINAENHPNALAESLSPFIQFSRNRYTINYQNLNHDVLKKLDKTI